MHSAIFWINAMGFHIWRLFNFGSSRKPFREDLKKFLFYALYAQGVPLLINIITAIIDSTRDKITPHYPNMGEHRCFLGENKMAHPNYFRSSKFIYNDVFLVLVQFVNGFFLISIGKVLRRGWKDQAERLKLMGLGIIGHFNLFNPQGGTDRLSRKVLQRCKERNTCPQNFCHPW